MTMSDKVFSASKAAKLDGQTRLRILPPGDVISTIVLRGDETVADIGAGTGYFALPLAHRLTSGHVHAVDLQPEMLAILEAKLDETTRDRISLHHGSASQTGLTGASVDLIFVTNVWHEIEDAAAASAHLATLLRQRGRLAIVEWRADISSPTGPPIEDRISPRNLCTSLCVDGWRVALTQNVGEYSYLVIFDRGDR